MKIWIAWTFAIFITICPALSLAEELSDTEKLALILDGKNQFTRAERMRGFEPEGVIDAVGRLVLVDGKVYFKTADQSYIPNGRHFPYPELFFELYLSQAYAYRPLVQQEIIKGNRILHSGPIRIKGNWAYERPYHLFALVWIDEATKVSASPEGDWNSYRQPSGNTPGPKGGEPKKKAKKIATVE